ncbi:MAG: HAD family hydrolase [Gammaproteobacteria bacterium]
MRPQINTILFDLDGTLIDTAPDLAYTLNLLREENGLATIPYEKIRPSVSNGANAILNVGFDADPTQVEFTRLKKRFLEIYLENLSSKSILFPGMDKLLNEIEGLQMNWGVVTNKPGYLTEPLMSDLNLDRRAACIVSGDSTNSRKPDPEPLMHACRQIDVMSGNCLYVGDAQRDIEAGRRAGMKTLVALFGYINQSDCPKDWHADGMISHPGEILDWIETFNKPDSI